MVIPRSRSSALLSITRSPICWFSRKMWLCLSIASTSVVFPWSTWAMIATLRMLSRFTRVQSMPRPGWSVRAARPIGRGSAPGRARQGRFWLVWFVSRT